MGFGLGLLLAIALSLDGFGVGLSYGLRRIRIPVASLGIIALCTVIAMSLSMLLGNMVTFWFTGVPVKLLGAGIIIALGLFQVIKAVKHQIFDKPKNEPDSLDEIQALPVMAYAQTLEKQIFRIKLSNLGLVIQVMRTPDMADIDGSGVISWQESILLGIALAVDAFVIGIGAAMTGMGLSLVILVAVIQIFFICWGQWLAEYIPERLISKVEFLPGFVLIMIGLGKIV